MPYNVRTMDLDALRRSVDALPTVEHLTDVVLSRLRLLDEDASPMTSAPPFPPPLQVDEYISLMYTNITEIRTIIHSVDKEIEEYRTSAKTRDIVFVDVIDSLLRLLDQIEQADWNIDQTLAPKQKPPLRDRIHDVKRKLRSYRTRSKTIHVPYIMEKLHVLASLRIDTRTTHTPDKGVGVRTQKREASSQGEEYLQYLIRSYDQTTKGVSYHWEDNPVVIDDVPMEQHAHGGPIFEIKGMRQQQYEQEFNVEWNVDANVPKQHAQQWLVLRSMTDEMKKEALRFATSMEEESEMSDDVVPCNSVLIWDPMSRRPKLSWARAIQSRSGKENYIVEALIEWTLTRIWALRSKAPPKGNPTEDELTRLGQDLYDIFSYKLDAEHARYTQSFTRRKRRIDHSIQDNAHVVITQEEWRAQKEELLVQEAELRWNHQRSRDKDELQILNDQLAALKEMRRDPGVAVDVSRFKTPPLRIRKIRDFLSVPYRSEASNRFLKLPRDEIKKGNKKSTYGDIWPSNPTPRSTPADHVTPIAWFDACTNFILEAGVPAQLPAVVMCTLDENSRKGDNALGVWLHDNNGSGSSGLFNPESIDDDTDETNRVMLAKHVAWVFGLYPLITNKSRTAGVTRYDNGGTGVAWWARSWTHGTLEECMTTKSSAYERRINLITAALPQWGVCNPAVFDEALIDDDMKKMLFNRLKGTCSTATLFSDALFVYVSEAPRTYVVA